LQPIHIHKSHNTHVADDLSLIEKALQQAISKADLVLVTGGVSVGDYDFVATALATCRVQKHFHRVKQKPGKPLYFGTSGNTLIFGLPGNPSSALTCFYEYVLIALHSLKGLSEPYIKPVWLPLAADYTKPAGLTHFLKGTTIDNQAMPLSAQESYRLRSFAVSNCLIVLDEIVSELKKGDLVEVHFLPK
jgi:molybdopterin molybdotransferase